MIRPNDFAPTNREDDLLQRLKSVVGSLETASKDNKKVTPLKESDSLKSKELFSIEVTNQRKYEPRSSYRQSLGNKQNYTDKKYHVRQNDYRKGNSDKQNCDILKMTKNYLESTRQNAWSYQADRKRSVPLVEIDQTSNIKRELFIKEVSESTKKRIAQRESFINGDKEIMTQIRQPDRQKNKSFSEDEFLQRLSLRKISYLESNPQKESFNSQCFKNTQNRANVSSNKNTQSTRKQRVSNVQISKPISVHTQERPRQQPAMIPMKNLPKYENYEKLSMENLVKDQELRKADKMQKLKKITNMNEEINKKIRRIVDTFENYLTHRQVLP